MPRAGSTGGKLIFVPRARSDDDSPHFGPFLARRVPNAFALLEVRVPFRDSWRLLD